MDTNCHAVMWMNSFYGGERAAVETVLGLRILGTVKNFHEADNKTEHLFEAVLHVDLTSEQWKSLKTSFNHGRVLGFYIAGERRFVRLIQTSRRYQRIRLGMICPSKFDRTPPVSERVRLCFS